MLSLEVAAVQDPVGIVEVELVGPCPNTTLSAGFESTRLDLHLKAGETRRFEAPYLSRVRLGGDGATPRLRAAILSRGTRLSPESGESPPDWEQLPLALQSRSLPTLKVTRPVVGSTRLIWMAAALLLVLALRRRPWAAAAVGAGAAALVFWLPEPVVEGHSVRVLEGDVESGRWLEVRGARDSLALPDPAVGWLRHLPQNRELELVAVESDSELGWTASARGARVYHLRELPGLRAPTRAESGGHRFEEAWLREATGTWQALGPWAPGAPLPQSIPSAGAPPGWLVAGLPQGVPILVGHLADGLERDAWMRLVGFE